MNKYRRRLTERTVFLPWERQGNLVHQLGLSSRVRPVVLTLGVILVLVGLGLRERHRAGVRATRATLLVAHQAVDRYRADHAGQCPLGGLETLLTEGYSGALPRDAWGHPLRLVCPTQHSSAKAYDLFSDGPDGEPGGLDQIE